MTYTLISSERSPFGRICRMYLEAQAIPFDFHILNFVDDAKAAAALAKETPINKVPILVLDNGERIFDSRVIMNYLMRKHGGAWPLSIEEENRISAIYSCMDVSVTLFLMRANGYDLVAANGYLKRQYERIVTGLEFVRAWAQSAQEWNYAAMALYSFLYWGERRAQTVRAADYPEFIQFMERFAAAPGVANSSF